MGDVLDGTDLILSVGGKALGYSTGCKITTSTETGERVTKEASAGKWKEKFVKSFSESINADGVVLTGSNAEMPTYDQLKDLQLAGAPVDGTYSVRVGVGRIFVADFRAFKACECHLGHALLKCVFCA